MEYIRIPRGTRDLIKNEALLHEYLIEEFKKTARLNGFKPIVTPTIEFFELFARKSGEEIKRSMYVFKDKAGRLLALRPEVTASVVRAYLRSLRGEPKPIMLYYVAQCFRYEEPQRGRYREFWQGGLEVIGDRDVDADLRVVSTATEYLDTIGIRHYYIVGNVGLYRIFMKSLGVNEDDQDHILHLIDKKFIDKAFKYSEKVNPVLKDVLRDLLSMNLNQLNELIGKYTKIVENKVDALEEEIKRTIDFIDMLNEIGINAIYDPGLVRGLAYYNSIIYEIKTQKLDISIGGGGRYDNLTMVYGGPSEYSTGMALGLDRIILILKKAPIIVEPGINVLVIVLDKGRDMYKIGFDIMKKLHRYVLRATIMGVRKISKALSYASRAGYTHAVIIGSREYEKRIVTIKNLVSKKQVSIPYGEEIGSIIEEYMGEN